MRGWLVTNAFLDTPKFAELYRRLDAQAAELGITLERRSNLEVCLGLAQESRPDFALFWDKDVVACRILEAQGVRTFNSSHAIAVCDSKTATYAELLQHPAIAQPRTIPVPLHFTAPDWSADPHARLFVDSAVAELGLPMIGKHAYGSFGQQVFVLRNRQDIERFLSKLGTTPGLLQQVISSSWGHDIRIQVVGGKVVASIERRATGDTLQANLTLGATATPIDAPESFASLAIATCEALSLDFAGVDLLVGPGGEPIVCEVNSNAHFVNMENIVGCSVAHEILTHVITSVEA